MMQSAPDTTNSQKRYVINRSKIFNNNQNILGIVLIVLALLISCCCLFGILLAINTSTRTPIADVVNNQTEIANLVNTQISASSGNLPTITPINPTPITPFQPAIAVPVPENNVNSSITSKVTGIISVTFIDVGQGDAILIQSPDGKYGLIDGGESGSGALQYLQSKGIDHLDLVIATHPHSDHIGGLVEILNTIPVSKITTNGQAHTTGVYENFLDAILATSAEYEEVKRGDQILLGDIVLDVIHPSAISSEDLNLNSIVIRLVYGQISFLFMGDANKDSDQDILASGENVKATIFKVGHHASVASFSSDFLAAVKPEIAIYSAGLGNDYDHPVPTTIDALVGAGAQVFGTDTYGSITVISDGMTYKIEKGKEPTKAPSVVNPIPPAVVKTEVTVVSVSSPIERGNNASLTIKTTPGANCTISVIYKNGPSNAAGLGPQIANQTGDITWQWKVGSSTTPGIWNIRVNCALGDKSSSINIPFEVKK